MKRLTCATAIVCLAVLQWPVAGQQPAPPAPAGQGRGGGLFPETEPDDAAGFVPIFDGKTLEGWEGDLTFWRAENGAIVGETTAEKVVKVNNFLIWRGGKLKDFELKVEFRLSGTNSGIQYPERRAAHDRQMGAEGLPGRFGFHGRIRRQHPRRTRPLTER